MDKTGTLVTYCHLVANLGGALSVFYRGKSAWVRLHGKEARIPLSEVRHSLDDGIKVAEIAKTYAYRNA